ncbi:MAG TPA: glycoside hydrolase domain-containing protein [Draconibacterium sp.]|nr:glycoside hydrolase domain-containing protein [Draconibacterium sp.]
MKIIAPLFFVIAFTLIITHGKAQTVVKKEYLEKGWKFTSIPNSPWPETFGNHRAVLEITKEAKVVGLDLFWRRHDRQPENKRFVIVEAASGDTVPNIYRHEVNNERCKISFGPVKKPGTYYFYYMPYEIQKEYGFYGKDYLKSEKAPSQEWVEKNKVSDVGNFKSFPAAKVAGIEARSAFDSFYPMEIIPLASEKKSLISKFTDEYLVFPEDRTFPIRMKDEIPSRWVENGPSQKFTGEALRNEYYAFQLGVFASNKDLQNVKIEFTTLKNESNEIPAKALTCFNTGGVDPYGKPFEKRVDVAKGAVQAFWIGVDIPEQITAGTYKGQVTVKPENAKPKIIDVTLKITDQVLADRGDSEPWRHSRLRWLNSTLGIDDKPTKSYDAIQPLGNRIYRLTDKQLSIAENGMPGFVSVNNRNVLAGSVSFIAETSKGEEQFSAPEDIEMLKNEPGIMSASWKSKSADIELLGIGSIESDGYINYRITLKALSDINLNDVRLEIPFSGEVAQYMMGMGLPGTSVPENHQSKWKGPYDSFWIGNPEGGIWCELRGSNYHGPLLNLYHPEPPSSWYNNDLGGFKIEKSSNETKAIVYSGARDLKANEEIVFEWSMLITPVKKINYKSQFLDRYYHNGGSPMPSDEDLACGVKIVNLHHANNYNPHINYPFVAVDSMKWFVDQLHKKGQKVKIYYTIRELTNYTTELWALRSLGDEILGTGRGGGYPWLREHLIDGYHPQWYQYFPDKSADASIVNAPGDSRWYNYYIEGLAWLVRNVDIDGLYLDDVSYDRRTVKRIRKVLDNEKPGCLLDLHSNTGFSKGPAMQYAEYFPYMDKIWFGESFIYDKMPPENWLVEVSGIPFGLMGDMLHGGGNRWMGMVYGMTVRHPWKTEGVTCDPRPVWKIWDDFGIESAKMIGYWEKGCPVRTNNPDVLATVYQKEGKSLISVVSWSDKPESFLFQFDWKALGIDAEKATLVTPEIKDFQQAKSFQVTDSIPIEPKKGWLMYLYEIEH